MGINWKVLAMLGVEAFIIAGIFMGLGFIVNLANVAIPVGVTLWTLLMTGIALPFLITKLVGKYALRFDMQVISGAALSIAIVGIIAYFFPVVSFLFSPFTIALSTGIIGIIAAVMQISTAITVKALLLTRMR